MIKVTLFIDNKIAHSCSPLKFLEKFILLDAKEINRDNCFHRDGYNCVAEFDNPYAKILVKEIEQE
jgi:hypothetical protein